MTNLEELAESYINGNISYVRNKIKKDYRIALSVAALVFVVYGKEQFNQFINIYAGGT